MTESIVEINPLEGTLCVLCLKPNPDTMKTMTTRETTSRSSRRYRRRVIEKTTTYTYPALPFHKKCLKKFSLENWIVYPILAAVGWWILGMAIIMAVESIEPGYAPCMIILALPLGFWSIYKLNLEHKQFENKLEKWKVALYGNVLSAINQQPQEIPEKTEEEQSPMKQRVENYGVEVVVCSSCGTINSSSFSNCLTCSKDLSKEKSIPNPYL